MTALDGCFNTSGLGAEWYRKACTIAIRHFTVYEKWKKRRQKRARTRSSSTKYTPTYRKESTHHALRRAKNVIRRRAKDYQLVDGQVHYSESIWQPLLRTSNTNEGTDLCLTSITGACHRAHLCHSAKPMKWMCLWAFCAGLCNCSLFRAESRMPTLQTVRNEGASTQMFGGRRYETLPIQDCKQSTAEKQNTLDVGNGTTKNACPYTKTSLEKKLKVWVVLWQL